MGRHTAPQGEAIEFQFDLAKSPAPGSRRAARMAERGVGGHGAFGHVGTLADEAPYPLLTTDDTSDAIPVYMGDAVDDRGDVPEDVVASKRGRFALFRRSRAAVAAVVAAASGVGAVASAMLVHPGTAEAHTLPPGTDAVKSKSAHAIARVTFTVNVDGQNRTITTDKPTLHQALKDAGIVVNANDKVSQEMASRVENGSEVKVTRVELKTVSEDIGIPHQTSEVQDGTLAKGERVVQTKGEDGVASNVYEVAYVGGKEVGRNNVLSAQKKQPVKEVVRVGTREAPAKPAAPSTPATPSGNGGNANPAPSTPAPSAPSTQAPSGNPQQIARSMLSSYGWNDSQFSCLVSLWNKESEWNPSAVNKSSGAYGIPQSLPGSKMASAGADWRTNPATQIRWGLGYIQGRYGTPCAAWGHSQATGWY